eukprot:TRINITY_DN121765_c0_g1_i1.p1 TRINITY_DN121765_c0_g1~~TRINITY_DN121765_c0_g1_i1.p1  ORF type:complete len:655 (-),score=146.97 TRINITY_DN121765_c0_g1_i1:120-2084(-)
MPRPPESRPDVHCPGPPSDSAVATAAMLELEDFLRGERDSLASWLRASHSELLAHLRRTSVADAAVERCLHQAEAALQLEKGKFSPVGHPLRGSAGDLPLPVDVSGNRAAVASKSGLEVATVLQDVQLLRPALQALDMHKSTDVHSGTGACAYETDDPKRRLPSNPGSTSDQPTSLEDDVDDPECQMAPSSSEGSAHTHDAEELTSQGSRTCSEKMDMAAATSMRGLVVNAVKAQINELNVAQKKKNLKQKRIRKRVTIIGPQPWLKDLVDSMQMEVIFGVLILLNALMFCVEAQYNGIEMGVVVSYSGSHLMAEQAWPHAKVIFTCLNFFFGVAFLLEALVKLWALRCSFFVSPFNLLDLSLVFLWVVTIADSRRNSLQFMRLARLARLLRLLRLFKVLHKLDVLILLVGALKACGSVMFWSLTLLLLVMTCFSLMLVYMLEPFILNEAISLVDRQLVYNYFGSFSRAILSVFELTLSNWVPVTRMLHDTVSEWYSPLLLAYRSVAGFAMISVITGVFLHETFRTAAADDDLMIMQRERAITKHVQKMRQLFHEADESCDGYLSFGEFQKIVEDKRVRTWLAAMELDIQDVAHAFRIIDMNGDGQLSAEELVRGVARMKGHARSLDLLFVMEKLENMEEELGMVRKKPAREDS